tara:strand:- start:2348 stop:2581 length:234 start_codon:yes stop_codon:yes gene_type:complete
MEMINKSFELVSNCVGKLTEVLLLTLALAIVGQVLYGAPVFGMDVVGNVVGVIKSLGDSGFVGLLAVILLGGVLLKK